MQWASALVVAFIGAAGVLAAVQLAIQLAAHRTVDVLVIAYFIGWTTLALAAAIFLFSALMYFVVRIVSAIVRQKPGDIAELWLIYGVGFVASIADIIWLIASGDAEYNRVSPGDRALGTWIGIGLLVVIAAAAPKLRARWNRN